MTLSLLEHSAPTAIDSRLIIQDASVHALPTDASSSHPVPSPLRSARPPDFQPPIELRLKTGVEDLAPDRYDNRIATSFKKNSVADRLQYEYV